MHHNSASVWNNKKKHSEKKLLLSGRNGLRHYIAITFQLHVNRIMLFRLIFTLRYASTLSALASMRSTTPTSSYSIHSIDRFIFFGLSMTPPLFLIPKKKVLFSSFVHIHSIYFRHSKNIYSNVREPSNGW